MRPYLIILIFLAGTVLARYHEKTRFDRSIDMADTNDERLYKLDNHFIAFRDLHSNFCYFIHLTYDRNGLNVKKIRDNPYFHILSNFTVQQTRKYAGDHIADFCKERIITLLCSIDLVPLEIRDIHRTFQITMLEDLLIKGIPLMILTRLAPRHSQNGQLHLVNHTLNLVKRHVELEQRKKLNENFNRIRQRRQTTGNQFRGKFRGQTQSQYLNLDSDEQKQGKAEAEATQQSSRAIVSGSRGMGQAQSMSSGGTGCEDCPGYPGYPSIEGAADKIRFPSTGTDRYVQGPGIGIFGTTRPGTEALPGGTSHIGDVTPDRQVTYPGGTGIYPVVPPGTRPGTYPGGVRPGTRPGIYPGDVRPGTATPGGEGTYPGGVQPGIVTSGDDATYPGGVRPGIIRPGGDGTYPGGVRPGTVIPGDDGTYPGGVRPGTVTPGADRIYPGTVQPGTVSPGGVRPGAVRPEGDGTYPGGIQPGAVRPGGDGTYPGVIQSGAVRPGGDGTYPGGIQPGAIRPGGDGIYPPATLITGDRGLYPGGIQPGRVPSTGVTTGVWTGAGTYPGGIQPGVQPGQGTYPPGGVTTSVTSDATAGIGTYPGTGFPSGTYPGTPGTGTYPRTGIYPGSVRPGTIPETGTGTYPGGVAPGVVPEGTGQGIYPGQQTGVPYPGGVVPGTLPGGSQVPSVITTTGSTAGAGTQVITYPGGPTDSRQIYPGGTIQPSRIPEGTGGAPDTQVTYPGGIYPGSGTYPGGTQQVTSPGGTLYPDQGTYPSGGLQVPTYQSGQYPGMGTRIPGGTGIPGGIQYPIGVTGDQTITGGTGVTGQYPGQYPGGINGIGVGTGQYLVRPYPATGGTTGTGEASQYYIQPGGPGGPAGVADDGAESQASSSVQQIDSGTQASASAQGKYGSGTAQSQVTGTYSGSGAFSAQAGTSDANKNVQTEVSGGKEGATSNAQGVAGYGKSQSQVQLDSDSGATLTDAQSSGWNHGTNSQVQASSRGGMADAQANGEGSTSSQAQIGFQPYLKNENEKIEKHTTPFRGSGTASAQSGTHRGQSQSQLQGSFQYGITYTGAAQAGSGSGAASSRKPFNFNITDINFKPPPKRLPSLSSAQLNPIASPNYENKQDDQEQGLQRSSTSRQTVVVGSNNNPDDAANKKVLATEKPRIDDTTYDDEYEDEYADEDYSRIPGPKLMFQEKFSGTFPSSDNQKLNRTIQQQDHSQLQTMQVAKGNRYDIRVNQDSNVPQTGDVLQPGQTVSDYTIPSGFRGRVTSISGTETIAQGDGKSQSQTVSLVPKDENITKSPITETRSLQINHERYIGRHISNNKSQRSSINHNASSDKQTRPTPAAAMKPSYYTVTNSFAGKMNGNNEPKKYEHRYYTKSSTCGYFTFSCNVVYGSNGRTKICKPKMPTYPNGMPMKC